MIEKIQRKFALSRQGAKDLIKGCFACFLQNLSLMFTVGLLYYLVEDLINGGIKSGGYWFYGIGIVVCLVLIFLATGFQYNGTYLATYVESGVRRINLAEKLRKLPLSYFGKRDLSDLTQTVMNDCAVLETAFSHYVPEFIGAIASTIVVSMGLFFFNWEMALASVWVIPVSLIIVAGSFKVQNIFSRRTLKSELAFNDGTQEYLETLRDLKSNNAEYEYLKGLDGKIDNLEKAHIKTELAVAAFVITAQLILKLGIATIILVGSMKLISGQLDVVTFFMFLLVASRLYDPLSGALQNLAAILSVTKNVERMNEIFDYTVQDGKDKLTNKGYDMNFCDVNFSYEGGEKVLNGVSFTAKQGQVTALVGPSGGGKTTVTRLATRFWDIDSGKITVGGMNISEIDPEKLLSLYSIVFQDVTLFNNSIMENIRIGKKDATDEEVLAAARLANCNEFVSKLQDGYSSLIGENGCQLSGGERQRISIARAFLKDAPIILLDEATASLDVDNETLIQSALSKLIKNKTVLVIAHRMRTVANADKIVVLKDGVVAEQGTSAQLMKEEGVYCNMVSNQNLSTSWEL